MDTLYDIDIVEWSEHQAALLWQLAEGRPGSEMPDWANIIDKVESVGRSQVTSVRSLLTQALAHDPKAQAWPQSPEVPHRQAEARGFRIDAEDAFTPSMRQRIDVDDLFRKALRRLPETIDGQPPLPLPETCPLTLDEMLAGR